MKPRQKGLFSQAEKDRRFYHENRRGNECLCGRDKKPGYDFCFRCYHQLPEENKRALWGPVSPEFIGAIEDAVRELKDYWDGLRL